MDRRISPDPYLLRSPHQVALAGDWHGNLAWSTQTLATLAGRGVDLVLHLGDFGIWPGDSGKRYLDAVEKACSVHGIDIFVTLGNHEDWGRVRGMWDGSPHKYRDENGHELPLRLTEHVTVLPRGWRFALASPSGADVSLVSLGGAPSIDFPHRRQGRDWWREEMIQQHHVDQVAAGGYADVFLAHDAPDIPYATPAVAQILANPQGWTPAGLNWAKAGRDLMHEAFLAVKPRLFVHGHFHVYDRTWAQIEDLEYATQIVSLNCDQAVGNYTLLDLDSVANYDTWGSQ